MAAADSRDVEGVPPWGGEIRWGQVRPRWGSTRAGAGGRLRGLYPLNYFQQTLLPLAPWLEGSPGLSHRVPKPRSPCQPPTPAYQHASARRGKLRPRTPALPVLFPHLWQLLLCLPD